MAQGGVSARAARRSVAPWWEELDSEAFREFPAARRPRITKPAAPDDRPVARPSGSARPMAARPVAARPAAAHPAAARQVAGRPVSPAAPPRAKVRAGGDAHGAGIDGRRTVTIRGRGAERNLPRDPADAATPRAARLPAGPDRPVGGAAWRAADPGGGRERARARSCLTSRTNADRFAGALTDSRRVRRGGLRSSRLALIGRLAATYKRSRRVCRWRTTRRARRVRSRRKVCLCLLCACGRRITLIKRKQVSKVKGKAPRLAPGPTGGQL